MAKKAARRVTLDDKGNPVLPQFQLPPQAPGTITIKDPRPEADALVKILEEMYADDDLEFYCQVGDIGEHNPGDTEFDAIVRNWFIQRAIKQADAK